MWTRRLPRSRVGRAAERRWPTDKAIGGPAPLRGSTHPTPGKTITKEWVTVDALQTAQQLNRRTFLARSGLNLGAMALGSLLGRETARAAGKAVGGLPGLPHFPPKAKRIIYLFQSGAPSQLDL